MGESVMATDNHKAYKAMKTTYNMKNKEKRLLLKEKKLRDKLFEAVAILAKNDYITDSQAADMFDNIIMNSGINETLIKYSVQKV